MKHKELKETSKKRKACTKKGNRNEKMETWMDKKMLHVGSCVDMSLVNDDLAFTFLSGQELPPLTLGLNISQHLNWRTSIPHICHFYTGNILYFFDPKFYMENKTKKQYIFRKMMFD